MVNRMRASLFWDQSYVGVVLNLGEVMVLEKIPDAIENILLESRPEFFVEKAIETIRAKGLGGAKTGEGMNYFFFRRNGAQKGVVFRSDSGREEV